MDPLFILTLFQHGYKVRTSTLYHLLKGKRTSSVLVYGYLYRNLRFFHLCPELSEQEFNRQLQSLSEAGLLTIDQSGEVQITAKGNLTLNDQNQTIQWLDNYRFGKTDEEIWRFLQFLVQVTSHLSYGDKKYIPLEQSPFYQAFLKQRIAVVKKNELIQMMKTEWHWLLSRLSKKEADYFAQQFSGYEQIGKTVTQILHKESTPFEQFLVKKERLHHLLYEIENMPGETFLKQSIQPFMIKNDNQSMTQTKKHLRQQSSIETIAQQRGMKKSTIQDHLLELALTEEIPFEQYISKETYQFLDQLSSPCPQWVYRTLKQKNKDLDYFEYRLYQIEKLKNERADTLP
ncbi:helix-turn-helix domain-containing protein [Enterococcus wangshanyuanii]|uniref:Helicase Helix-turn-helix domain-containing protein n=1 Tax=Enterococcus wangshanyuanii TaxID=2005703 RepID=A0ABQ1NMU8_9ENTE|nr:helix-turn-helix domain-containing protein [Enterococcus wangshanyuanii]GGC80980.1 hypothetical protein GCM10011573_08230 [Enterococcus wangshanyuanii]